MCIAADILIARTIFHSVLKIIFQIRVPYIYIHR